METEHRVEDFWDSGQAGVPDKRHPFHTAREPCSRNKSRPERNSIEKFNVLGALLHSSEPQLHLGLGPEGQQDWAGVTEGWGSDRFTLYLKIASRKQVVFCIQRVACMCMGTGIYVWRCMCKQKSTLGILFQEVAILFLFVCFETESLTWPGTHPFNLAGCPRSLQGFCLFLFPQPSILQRLPPYLTFLPLEIKILSSCYYGRPFTI